MVMKKKKIMIISAVVLVIIVASFLVLRFTRKNMNKPKPEKKETVLVEAQLEDNIRRFANGAVSSKQTLKSLRDLTNNPYIDISHAMYGKDSTTNTKVDKDLKGSTDLSAYEKVQDKLVKKLEDKMAASYSYEYVTDFIYESPQVATRKVRLQSYLFCYYYNDVSYFLGYLLSKSGYDGTETEKEYLIAEYKAKIKAMQVLDSHLDDYVSDEVYEMELIYEVVDDKMRCTNCEKYLEYVKGFYSSRIQDYPEERMEQFLNEGIEKGILKKNNLLAI